MILVTLDGVAARQLAQEWAATGRASTTVFAGATFILLGLALALDASQPRSSGWIAVAAGLGSVAAASVQAFIGESTDVSRVLTIIGPTVITLWVTGYGIVLLREARRLRRPTNLDHG